MNTIKEKLKKVSKLTPYELFVNRWIIFILTPSIYLYSLLILQFNSKAFEVPWVKEFLLIILAICGFFSYSKKSWIVNNYAWIAFTPMLIFNHYLIHVTYINNFSIDYLLATYVFTFGMMVMASSRLLMIIFCSTQIIHIVLRVYSSNLDTVTEMAILMSMTAVLIFSFIVLNGFVRYRNYLRKMRFDLEIIVKERTKDLELRAIELQKRNDDLEQFAYVVSHDLKRPLRNIYTISHWLFDDYNEKLNSEITDNLKLIKDETFYMDKLIDGILNYSLSETNNQEKSNLDLNDLLNNLLKVNEHISIKLIKELPKITFNETQITQVFQNLFENAIKYNSKQHKKIEVDYTNQENEYVFSVKDNGNGISKKHHKKIFQLFQRLETESSNQNLGIGLAMVKKIIENTGGKIWLKSEKNIGSTFYFTILKNPISNSLK